MFLWNSRALWERQALKNKCMFVYKYYEKRKSGKIVRDFVCYINFYFCFYNTILRLGNLWIKKGNLSHNVEGPR